ncbi:MULTISPECIES: TetR/AcrR family transcriptional regulator [unclassified Saccharopolyspora]|uniref:TetR/AcrR family transcriptional regulator n=1 Tax=unclassified Saccharopolyspora TaxID=2646250 RepID=UPI001CD674E8|nr:MULTISPECIES: TetR/AcrR family transcriptional regulator [unclassified Saccharopolyspora]MCA1187684.1 TetR/AcrR family transcriptional regulator [Saccharopolyspora sp. 6T]MCA1193854.1 TetR/AcrR family transcriptional regulator [Saccharopolyspora sp. 6V]MCA1226504.1 TetR/AcrR family transcriptional regulator [Saccharopolyspora sp. 6M]MCA1281133.1 TetR/AcrR family transcriptional regulator [Saccharopolyspora sp. 7B]
MPQRRNRRVQLADAAIEVLARDGGRGLTHRAVDREAGFPEGTTKNYHPNRDSLYVAIARRMADQQTAAMRRLRENMPEGVSADDVRALYLAMLRRMAGAARSQFLALFELQLEGVRNPQVRSALGEMTLAGVDSAVTLHAAVGEPISARGGGLLEAGMMGVAMSMLSLPDDVVGRIGFGDPDELGRSLLGMAVDAEPADGLLRGQAS